MEFVFRPPCVFKSPTVKMFNGAVCNYDVFVVFGGESGNDKWMNLYLLM